MKKHFTPQHWASLKPFGIGEQHPNNFAEVFRAIGENRQQLGYALRILNNGVCDGCALGTTGMKDWTLDGVHLCNIRLRLLKLNTMPPLDAKPLANIRRLMGNGRLPKASHLRQLGRIPYPMLRQHGEDGFKRISWDDALDLVAKRIQASTPDRLGFYLTSRGIPNEVYYACQKAVRAMGTNSIDNAARLCHSPSTSGLKAGLGVAATTCSYSDWLKSDLIVFFGSNVANNQPVATKYLHHAKINGAKMVCVNNTREPGMENYWIPSIPQSALFGTKLADRFFLVNIGGDVAFINGVLKHVVAQNWVDEAFISQHTAGYEQLKQTLANQSWAELTRLSGASKDEMLDFAIMLRDANKAVFVWSMGITQHETGAQGVQAIINLALTKGFVGREGCGLMPIRGHSGVQGGAEMGAYSTVFPAGRAITPKNAEQLSQQYGFPISSQVGMTAPQMLDAAHEGKLDMLFSIGGNFLEVLPEPDVVEQALQTIPLRVHMDIVLSPQMFLDSAEATLILPATTRYEIPDGVTQTSTERRIIFSPEIAGPRIAEARPESDVLLELARRVRPEWADKLHFASTHAIRQEIAQVVPYYKGIETLRQKGDTVQYGGAHLCANWQFPTEDGKAHFASLQPPETSAPEGMFAITTRRGKQFNSIIHEKVDQLNGAVRDAVLINADDARRLGLRDGDTVRLHNDIGEMNGRLLLAPIAPNNLQVHWPEGNVLLRRGVRSPEAGIPDYNGFVFIEKVGA